MVGVVQGVRVEEGPKSELLPFINSVMKKLYELLPYLYLYPL